MDCNDDCNDDSSTTQSRVMKKRAQLKAYYQRNRNRILAKQREATCQKFTCPCGAEVASVRRILHEASDKHQRYVQSHRQLEALAGKLKEGTMIISEALLRAAASLVTPEISV
jgi:hypothetical protein